jgi:hypothetical protein
MINWIKRRGKEEKYNDEESPIYASKAPSSR